jgi:uncharacterized protein with HEPN domain
VKAERRYIDFMQDIVDNLEKAESFTEGLEFKDFLEDELMMRLSGRLPRSSHLKSGLR